MIDKIVSQVFKQLSFLIRFIGFSLLSLVYQSGFALQLEVQIEGLADQLQANVQALLAIYQERKDSELTPEKILLLHQQAPEQIRKALEPFGFYRIKIIDQLKNQDQSSWIARYQIDLGEPIRIRTIEYQIIGAGAQDSSLPQHFPLQTGDVLLHFEYEQAKAKLRAKLAAAGYLDAQLLKHQVIIDLVDYSARIEVVLDTGSQYRFGEVHFQQDLFAESWLQKYLTAVAIKSGDLYNPERLLALQASLLGTEYFKDVEIRALKDQIDVKQQIPLLVKAKRNKANKYRVGLGFATDVGPRLSLDWQRRYLNQWGHKFRTELNLNENLSHWKLEYRIPLQDPTRDYLILAPQVTNYDTATRKGWVSGVQVSYSIVEPNGWRRDVGVAYQYEDLMLNSNQANIINELIPMISWSRTVADNPIYTQQGYYFKSSLMGAVQGLISTTSYCGSQFELKWITSFAKKYRLITRGELGAIWAAHLTDLPAVRRFYAGGDHSIRGWGYDALGPTDARTDQTVGGRYLAVGSLEIERRLFGPWSAAIFTDFGNAFDPDYPQNIAHSAGFGVRWDSPIGQVRMDLAFAFDKVHGSQLSNAPPARLHITIGPDL